MIETKNDIKGKNRKQKDNKKRQKKRQKGTKNTNKKIAKKGQKYQIGQQQKIDIVFSFLSFCPLLSFLYFSSFFENEIMIYLQISVNI